MATEMGYKDIMQLAEELSASTRKFTGTAISDKEVEQMCDSARELYERLVVLRHKGRERWVGKSAGAPEERPAHPTPVMATSMTRLEEKTPVAKQEAPAKPPAKPDVVEELKQVVMPELTLDLGEAVQTSLLDEIGKDEVPQTAPMPAEMKPDKNTVEEERGSIERMASTKPVQAPVAESVSVAEKLGSKPIGSLSGAIGLNQKFMFISQIFDGNKGAFAAAISELEHTADAKVAKAMASNLVKDLSDEDEDDVVAKKQFLDLIDRRFQ